MQRFVASLFDFVVTKSNMLNDYSDMNINESHDDDDQYFLTHHNRVTKMC